MISRPDYLRALATHRADEIVVSTFVTALEWMELSPSDLNYTFIGAMGQRVSHGLGLALAFPERRVVVLDDGGSLLMSLGSLVTVAEAAPRNLVHLLFSYYSGDVTVGQREARRVSYAGMARAAGYPLVQEYEELAAFRRDVRELLAADGPVFAELKASAARSQSPEEWDLLFSEERQRTFQWAARSRLSPIF